MLKNCLDFTKVKYNLPRYKTEFYQQNNNFNNISEVKALGSNVQVRYKCSH